MSRKSETRSRPEVFQASSIINELVRLLALASLPPGQKIKAGDIKKDITAIFTDYCERTGEKPVEIQPAILYPELTNANADDYLDKFQETYPATYRIKDEVRADVLFEVKRALELLRAIEAHFADEETKLTRALGWSKEKGKTK